MTEREEHIFLSEHHGNIIYWQKPNKDGRQHVSVVSVELTGLCLVSLFQGSAVEVHPVQNDRL